VLRQGLNSGTTVWHISRLKELLTKNHICNEAMVVLLMIMSCYVTINRY